MAWVGILDGRVLPPYWFEGSVNQVSYLDMLKNDVWPLIQRVVHTRRYWFQQDGASCHVTRKVMDFWIQSFLQDSFHVILNTFGPHTRLT